VSIVVGGVQNRLLEDEPTIDCVMQIDVMDDRVIAEYSVVASNKKFQPSKKKSKQHQHTRIKERNLSKNKIVVNCAIKSL